MNIVLVHGAYADGSSWSAVIERLQADVARLRQVLARQNGPTIVVGHSYTPSGSPRGRSAASWRLGRGHETTAGRLVQNWGYSPE